MGVNVVIILFFYQHWRYDPRQEPDAAIPHVRIRAGGRPRGRFLPRHDHTLSDSSGYGFRSRPPCGLLRKFGLNLPDLQSLNWIIVRQPSSSVALPIVTDLGAERGIRVRLE